MSEENEKYMRMIYIFQLIMGFIEGTVATMAGACCLMAGGFLGYLSGVLLCVFGMSTLFVLFHPNRKTILTNQTVNIIESGTFSDYCESTDQTIAKEEEKE